MPVKKIKSKDYLDYLGGKGCVVSGRTGVDLHHESVTRRFSGASKRYFDFGAVPLNHDIHLNQRHAWGRVTFWEYYAKDPVEIVIELIQEYINEGREDAELAANALEMVKEDNGYYP